MEINRVILIVLDSVGIGELPDAKEYGDEGSNTLGNIAKYYGGIKLPNMCALGLGKVEGINYMEIPEVINGSYGRMAEASKGKDTITGHWEIAGIQLEHAFPLYPQGFPHSIIEEFKQKTGTHILGNYAASGTEIIKELGEMHVTTGFPIVYTSGDSVFQIAAHEDVIPLDRLYEMCKIARGIMIGAHTVGRVVARPFNGKLGNYVRTANRRDFSIAPVSSTILEKLKENSLDVIAVGKIEDIYSGRGITQAVHTRDNMHGVDLTLEYMQQSNKGLIFTNLVDFDMLYGHRNDPQGYKKALEEFDLRLPEIYSNMREEDLLIITADHGCDPVTSSTDHSREYVPILLKGKHIKNAVNLGTRATFSDVACTIADLFGLKDVFPGESFL